MKNNKDPLGYYKALKLTRNANDDEIKQNYREEAKIWHPDSNTSENALEVFQEISVAYDILKDKEKKLTYDLLSEIYNERNFPEMFSLKILSISSVRDNLSVRRVSLKKSISKIYKFEDKKVSEICDFKKAKSFVFKISLWNWVFGWWSLKGFFRNFQNIFSNIKNIDRKKEDVFDFFIHNALAYNQEKRKSEAAYFAKNALNYANHDQKEKINEFIENLGEVEVFPAIKWDYKQLKTIQMIIPSILILVILFFAVKNSELAKIQKSAEDKINYYQEVEHMGGRRGFDDVVVSNVFNIPVDIENDRLLFHVKDSVNVMHGPNRKFDVLSKIPERTTVRVTGYTPDNEWYRIMLDNGQMGFVLTKDLAKGIGKSIPKNSKISYPRED